jgi:hypothetical protein
VKSGERIWEYHARERESHEVDEKKRGVRETEIDAKERKRE